MYQRRNTRNTFDDLREQTRLGDALISHGAHNRKRGTHAHNGHHKHQHATASSFPYPLPRSPQTQHIPPPIQGRRLFRAAAAEGDASACESRMWRVSRRTGAHPTRVRHTLSHTPRPLHAAPPPPAHCRGLLQGPTAGACCRALLQGPTAGPYCRAPLQGPTAGAYWMALLQGPTGWRRPPSHCRPCRRRACRRAAPMW